MDQFSAYEKCLQLGGCHPGNDGQMAPRGRCVPAPGPGGVKTVDITTCVQDGGGQGGVFAGMLCVAPSSLAPSDTPLGPILLCPLPSQTQAAVVIPSFLPFPFSFIDSVESEKEFEFIFHNNCQQSGFDLSFSLYPIPHRLKTFHW